jgi:hypothetical protein
LERRRAIFELESVVLLFCLGVNGQNTARIPLEEYKSKSAYCPETGRYTSAEFEEDFSAVMPAEQDNFELQCALIA